MNKNQKTSIIPDMNNEISDRPVGSALPLLLCTVTFAICLITLIIDRFIYSIGSELLAPTILQIIAIIIPTYLAIMLDASNRPIGRRLKDIGMVHMRAEHTFFVIFSSLFAMCASLIITLIFGGAEDAAHGITLLGVFTAGENEYSFSAAYLIITYALIPAIAEEVLFRGFVFSKLQKTSLPFAMMLSSLLYSFYGFSLGRLIPTFFIGILLSFVMYTTHSLICCILMHLFVNLYRLFIEPNIASYFLSSQNNILLLITILIALLISSILFFSEGARIYRSHSEKIADKKGKTAGRFANIRSLIPEMREMITYKPNLVFCIICLCIFITSSAIDYFT